MDNTYRADAIRELQKNLRTLSYHNSNIPAVLIDGIYGEESRSALLAYQHEAGLPETGIADRQTWDSLASDAEKAAKSACHCRHIPVFYSATIEEEIDLGHSGIHIRMLQAMLRELSLLYDGFDEVPQNGVYDEETSLFVKQYQRSAMLEETGKVDRKTWDHMAETYEYIFYHYNQ